MGIARGPNIVTDGLVFGYDTGYGVSDNNTTTRFYPGEVTTNQADTDAKRNWGTHNGAASSTTTAPEKGPGWKKLTITNIYGSNYRLAQFPYRFQASGTNRTYSVEYDVTGLTGYFLFVDGSVGYSQTSISGRGRYSFTTGVVSGSKNLAIFIGKSGTHNNINDVIYYKEYQVEVKGHATPFTATSRSSTESLIDLKKTTNIDVSNVSFDSTGQPTFDGTDDYLPTSFTRGTLGDVLTMIAYYKFDGNTSRTYTPVFGGMESGAGTEFFIGKNSGNTHIGVQDGNYIGAFVQGSNAWDGNYHQIVYTYSNGSGKIYLDGVLKNTGTFTKCNSAEQITVGREAEGSGYWFIGDISRACVYNKVFTAEEVLKDFNAYKNRFNI